MKDEEVKAVEAKPVDRSQACYKCKVAKASF